MRNINANIAQTIPILKITQGMNFNIKSSPFSICLIMLIPATIANTAMIPINKKNPKK